MPLGKRAQEQQESFAAQAREQAALERDAARYRWLRDPDNIEHPAWTRLISAEVVGEEYDRIVDEAMRLRGRPIPPHATGPATFTEQPRTAVESAEGKAE